MLHNSRGILCSAFCLIFLKMREWSIFLVLALLIWINGFFFFLNKFGLFTAHLQYLAHSRHSAICWMNEHSRISIIFLKGMPGLLIGTWGFWAETVYVISISWVPVVWDMSNVVPWGDYDDISVLLHSTVSAIGWPFWLSIISFNEFECMPCASHCLSDYETWLPTGMQSQPTCYL